MAELINKVAVIRFILSIVFATMIYLETGIFTSIFALFVLIQGEIFLAILKIKKIV